MELKNLSYFPSYNNFLNSYSVLENRYFKYRDCEAIPLTDDEFTQAFFSCFDFLSSLKKEDIEFLKTDLSLHCKITMFDTIKLHLISQNPSLRKIRTLHKIF